MMRFGIHSGPVTAGVLRGERSRFQLFGDTVNMASRMESTGEPGKIHCSETTANILIRCGRKNLVEKRVDSVNAKGKGRLNTFWIVQKRGHDLSLHSSATSETKSESIISTKSGQDRMDRLVDWNVEMLHRQLLNLLNSRELFKSSSKGLNKAKSIKLSLGREAPITHVKEAIPMPGREIDGIFEDHTQMSSSALLQLRHYVRSIATMYKHTNPFHNFGT